MNEAHESDCMALEICALPMTNCRTNNSHGNGRPVTGPMATGMGVRLYCMDQWPREWASGYWTNGHGNGRPVTGPMATGMGVRLLHGPMATAHYYWIIYIAVNYL